MNCLMGIDIGTSGTKAVIFNENGEPLNSCTYEYSMIQPKNGWAEQNPSDWWDAAVICIKTLLSNSGISPADIKGIGLTGQMHGLVLLNKHGQILRNAIIWCDSRTKKQCEKITEKIGAEEIIFISANPVLPGFTAGKILWVRENEPDIYNNTAHILLPKDYIRYKLSDVYATDVSDASGTNLFDVKNRVWSDVILNKLHIDPALLPEVYESPDITGEVSAEAAKITGLKEGTPIVAGAGDNAAAAVGTGIVENGLAVTTIGTSGVIFAYTDKEIIDPKGRVHTICHAVPGKWAVMSCTLAAGLSLKWYRDNFCGAEKEAAAGMGTDTYEIMNRQIETRPIGANNLIFMPYLMGERSPLLNTDARGVFFGLSAMHDKFDLMRAVMEGVTYSQKNCLDVFIEMGLKFREMILTGGGAKSYVWQQMLADVYGIAVNTIKSNAGPSLGAAVLAGVGAKIYPSVQDACKKIIKKNRRQAPISENTAEYKKYYNLYLSLYENLKSSFTVLAEM